MGEWVGRGGWRCMTMAVSSEKCSVRVQERLNENASHSHVDAKRVEESCEVTTEMSVQ